MTTFGFSAAGAIVTAMAARAQIRERSLVDFMVKIGWGDTTDLAGRLQSVHSLEFLKHRPLRDHSSEFVAIRVSNLIPHEFSPMGCRLHEHAVAPYL